VCQPAPPPAAEEPSNVVPIRPGIHIPNQPAKQNEELVRALEEMLAEARSGEIKGLVCARTHHDGATSRVRVGEGNYVRMIGDLFMLIRVMGDLDDQEDEEDDLPPRTA
jgi:hypothetical protein